LASLNTIRDAVQGSLRGEQASPRWLIAAGLLAVGLAVAFFFVPHLLDPRFRVSWDGSFYLSEARYLYDGQGYLAEPEVTQLGRPPGFVALLATAFVVGGPSVEAAMWVVRLAGLAAAVAIAGMSYRMFGAGVALLVVAWAVTNEFFAEYFARILLLDMTQVALSLAFVWLVFEAARHGSLRTYALTGVAFAAAFWVKESVLLILPLPVIAVLINPSWHTWRHARGLVAYGLTVGLLILPWFLFVFLKSGTLYRADSAARPDLLPLLAAVLTAGGLAGFWMWRRRRAWVTRLATATAAPGTRALLGWGAALLLVGLTTIAAGIPGPEDISRHFTERVGEIDLRPLGYLGPFTWAVMPLGWLFAFRGAVRCNPADVVLVAALLVSLSVIAFVADRNLAPRNYLLVLMLTHVVLGRVVVSLALWAWDTLRDRGEPRLAGFADVAVGILLGLSFWLPAQVAAGNLVFAGYTPVHGHQSQLEQATLVAQWTQENVPPGERIHVLASPGGAVLRFTLGETYQAPWVRMEWVQQEDLEAGLKERLPGKDTNGRPYSGLSGVVFINVNPSPFVGDRETERPELRVVQVPDLVTGDTPQRLVWIRAGAARVFPEVMLEFLLNTGLATELLDSQSGARVLQLAEPALPNVLLINEQALDELDGTEDGTVRLSPGLKEALHGWQVIVLAADNTILPPARPFCDDLRTAVAGIECWDGLLEYPVATGRNVAPLSLAVTPETADVQPEQSTSLTAVYHDSNGAADLQRVYLMINHEWDTHGACYVQYNQQEGQLYIYNDGWIPAGEPGEGSLVQTPTCTLNPSDTSVTAAGNQLRVQFHVHFASDFAGPYPVWLGAEDANGQWSRRTEAGEIFVGPNNLSEGSNGHVAQP
jgi:4-amino-4-deoxy-L-arabinose transferase-like glycosyltransferase